MARGVDSSRDPRRNLTARQIAQIAAQRERAQFLAGSEARFPVDAELRAGRRSTEEGRQSEIDAMTLENDALVSALMQPEFNRRGHTMRQATPRIAAPDPSYGKTKKQWELEQAGVGMPKGWPTASDPFPFGAEAMVGRKSKSASGGDDV